MIPKFCYEILNGKIGKPIMFNSINEKPLDLINKIKKISNDEVRIFSKECLKYGQAGLKVGYGGTHMLLEGVRIFPLLKKTVQNHWFYTVFNAFPVK